VYTDKERLEEATHDERLARSDCIASHWTEPVVGILYGNRVVIEVAIDHGEIMGIERVVWDDGHEERFDPGDEDWLELFEIVSASLPQYTWG